MNDFLIPTRPGLVPPPPMTNNERVSRWASQYFMLPVEQRHPAIGVVGSSWVVTATNNEEKGK